MTESSHRRLLQEARSRVRHCKGNVACVLKLQLLECKQYFQNKVNNEH